MEVALDADQLVDAACEATGLDDFGGATFRTGLDRLLEGLQTEASLNPVGAAAAPSGLGLYLRNRLEVTDWHGRHPEIADADVTPPVVMIGMGRTGTTIIHDLLGQDPANRIPRTWEVDRPCPPPEAATALTDPRIAEVQAGIDAGHAARPDIRAMHPTGALLGQECIRFTACEFASVIFLSQFRLPSYLRWVTAEADMGPVYRWHRRFLQLLQWRDTRERWVLKSGAHLWALPTLVATYPNATFVQTHRDPVRVIASLSSLFAAIHRSFSDDVSVDRIAADWAGPILDALDRSVTAREDGTIPPDRVIDAQYEAFMADPFRTIRSIYDHWEAPFTADVEAGMRAFLADNTRDKHGVHRYAVEDTGLDPGELRERSRRYCEYFDVPAEGPA